MRAISADQERLLVNPQGRATRVRVRVKDSGGTFRDLSTYVDGIDMVVSARWSEDVDSNGYVAEIEMRRNHEGFSISPFQEDSALNHGFNPSSSYAPLLDVGRVIVIEWAMVPLDVEPTLWVEGFRGYIDTLNLEGDPISISCRDQAAAIVDTFIERERVYGYAQDDEEFQNFSCFIFETFRTFVADQLVIPSQQKLNGHFYKCTTGGDAGGTEPDIWPATPHDTIIVGACVFENDGTTSADVGTAVETVMQRILNDSMCTTAMDVSAVPALYVPTTPAWAIRWFVQQREMTWGALRALAEQIGWDLRYKWHDGSSAFRLTLWSPDRAKTAADRSFGEYDGPRFDGVKKLSVDRANIRNVVRVIYSDYADKDASGTMRRKIVESVDAASVTSYGRRFMEVAESSSSNIDTSAEATDMAEAILSDLAQPRAEYSVEIPFFPFAELGDLYEYAADERHFSVAQKFANVSIEHRVGPEGAVTTLGARGKVSGGYRRWLKKDVRSQGPIDVHATTMVSADDPSIVTVPIVGGTRIKTEIEQVPSRPNMRFEHHLGDLIGFTPDSSTLQCVTENRDVVIPDQVPGATQYHRVVPIWFNGSRVVRGLPSRSTAVVHGRAKAGHIDSAISLGSYPLNGGFETRFDPAGMPDHWTIDAGVFGTDVQVMEDGNGMSGGRYLRLVDDGTPDPISVITPSFPIVNDGAGGEARAGGLYRFHLWRKNASGNTGAAGLEVLLIFYKRDGTVASSSGTMLAITGTDKKGHWVRDEFNFTPAADVDTRSVAVRLVANGNFTIDVDEVRVEYLGTPWYQVGVDSATYTDSYDQVPAFENLTINRNETGDAPAAFRRNVEGRVFLQGDVAPGAYCAGEDETDGGGTLFTLPESFRHPFRLRFIVESKGLIGHVTVMPTGEVRAVFGEAGHLSLNGISFETFSLAAPAVYDLSAGLIAYWVLESDSTDSVGSSDGTDSGVTYGAGKVGNGLIGGASAKVSLPNTGLQPAGSVSVAAWVKTTASGQAYIFSSDKVDYPYNYGGFTLLQLPTTHKAQFVIGKGLNAGFTPGNDFQLANSTTSINDGSWHLVVGTYDGSNIKMYVDGVLESTQAWASGLAYTGPGSVRSRIACESVTIFGASTDPYYPWPGSIDEIGVWSRALSSTEVVLLYNGGTGRTYPL